jgi:hypothetical protein
MRLRLTQTTIKYFIITAVSSFSGGNTTITMYGGTVYTLANAAISLNSYSGAKSPFGFPLDPSKWTEKLASSATDEQTNCTLNQFYNLGSRTISVPIGSWILGFEFNAGVISSTGAAGDKELSAVFGISTSSSSWSDDELRLFVRFDSYIATVGDIQIYTFAKRDKNVVLASKTTYYLLGVDQIGGSFITTNGSDGTTVLRAVCAYL